MINETAIRQAIAGIRHELTILELELAKAFPPQDQRTQMLNMTFGQFVAHLKAKGDARTRTKSIFHASLDHEVRSLFTKEHIANNPDKLKLRDLPMRIFLVTSEEALLRVRNVGAGSIEVLKEILREYGLEPFTP